MQVGGFYYCLQPMVEFPPCYIEEPQKFACKKLVLSVLMTSPGLPRGHTTFPHLICCGYSNGKEPFSNLSLRTSLVRKSTMRPVCILWFRPASVLGNDLTVFRAASSLASVTKYTNRDPSTIVLQGTLSLLTSSKFEAAVVVILIKLGQRKLFFNLTITVS